MWSDPFTCHSCTLTSPIPGNAELHTESLTLFHAIVQGEAFFDALDVDELDALDVDELACPP